MLSLRLDAELSSEYPNTVKPWRVAFPLNLVEFTETFYFLVNTSFGFRGGCNKGPQPSGLSRNGRPLGSRDTLHTPASAILPCLPAFSFCPGSSLSSLPGKGHARSRLRVGPRPSPCTGT